MRTDRPEFGIDIRFQLRSKAAFSEFNSKSEILWQPVKPFWPSSNPAIRRCSILAVERKRRHGSVPLGRKSKSRNLNVIKLRDLSIWQGLNWSGLPPLQNEISPLASNSIRHACKWKRSKRN